MKRHYDRNREALVEKSRKYRAKNPEKLVEIRAKSYHKHVESNRSRSKANKKANPVRNRIYRHNYYAKRRENGGQFTETEWKDLIKFYDYRCLKCSRREPEIRLTLDHIVPVSLGGKHEQDNIQPLCKSCNSSKRNKIQDYRQSTGETS